MLFQLSDTFLNQFNLAGIDLLAGSPPNVYLFENAVFEDYTGNVIHAELPTDDALAPLLLVNDWTVETVDGHRSLATHVGLTWELPENIPSVTLRGLYLAYSPVDSALIWGQWYDPITIGNAGDTIFFAMKIRLDRG